TAAVVRAKEIAGRADTQRLPTKMRDAMRNAHIADFGQLRALGLEYQKRHCNQKSFRRAIGRKPVMGGGISRFSFGSARGPTTRWATSSSCFQTRTTSIFTTAPRAACAAATSGLSATDVSGLRGRLSLPIRFFAQVAFRDGTKIGSTR